LSPQTCILSRSCCSRR